ncbi:hypothetical protein Tco_0996292, partial [Tanacetum coccineum]
HSHHSDGIPFKWVAGDVGFIVGIVRPQVRREVVPLGGVVVDEVRARRSGPCVLPTYRAGRFKEHGPFGRGGECRKSFSSHALLPCLGFSTCADAQHQDCCQSAFPMLGIWDDGDDYGDTKEVEGGVVSHAILETDDGCETPWQARLSITSNSFGGMGYFGTEDVIYIAFVASGGRNLRRLQDHIHQGCGNDGADSKNSIELREVDVCFTAESHISGFFTYIYT